MRLFDKFTGTRRPPSGMAAYPAEDVRAALLALNQPHVPFLVRGGAAEGVDVVAEWRILEPAWQTLFGRSQVHHALQVLMRFDAVNSEVHSMDRQWVVNWFGGTPRLTLSSQYTKGQVRKSASRRWTIERKGKLGFKATETFRYSASDLKRPLQNAVLAHGWTWRGVPLKS
ncbi:hypothetical protein [Streptomyces reniochalinae]|uniref:hypothetical protein n=1 Tax=Streptomyces reniochalinae TaxID=2250578 RepID=UPI0011C02FEF|nr:hypothetical protein [Streptomyces reniochalinae]